MVEQLRIDVDGIDAPSLADPLRDWPRKESRARAKISDFGARLDGERFDDPVDLQAFDPPFGLEELDVVLSLPPSPLWPWLRAWR